MENIAVCVADGMIDKDFLGELIYSIIYEDDFEESLKVKLANILLKMQERISLEGNNDDNF